MSELEQLGARVRAQAGFRYDPVRSRRRMLWHGGPAAVGSNPLTMVAWREAHWAGDPNWTPPGDGVALSSWRNGGSTGGAATQAVGADQPLYRASVAQMNNRPAVEFNTSDSLTASVPFSSDFPSTLVVVCRWIGSGIQSVTPGIMVDTTWKLDQTTDVDSGVNATTTPFVAIRGYCPANSGTSNVLTVNGASTVGGFAAARFDNSGLDIQAGFQVGFIGEFNGNVTTDPGWATFVAWVSSHYGLTIS